MNIPKIKKTNKLISTLSLAIYLSYQDFQETIFIESTTKTGETKSCTNQFPYVLKKKPPNKFIKKFKKKKNNPKHQIKQNHSSQTPILNSD
jgi:hypothetical protein